MMRTAARLAAMSEWIDEGNAHRDAEAITWGRIAKVSEEQGEAIAAFIGATGQNPRKGYTHTSNDVVDELLDVAVTALGAVEHLTGNRGRSLGLLDLKVDAIVKRAGLEPSEGGGRVAEESETDRVSPAPMGDAGSRERLDPLAAATLGADS